MKRERSEIVRFTDNLNILIRCIERMGPRESSQNKKHLYLSGNGLFFFF